MNYFEDTLFLGCFFSPPWAGAHDTHEGAVAAAASNVFLKKGCAASCGPCMLICLRGMCKLSVPAGRFNPAWSLCMGQDQIPVAALG